MEKNAFGMRDFLEKMKAEQAADAARDAARRAFQKKIDDDREAERLRRQGEG